MATFVFSRRIYLLSAIAASTLWLGTEARADNSYSCRQFSRTFNHMRALIPDLPELFDPVPGFLDPSGVQQDQLSGVASIKPYAGVTGQLSCDADGGLRTLLLQFRWNNELAERAGSLLFAVMYAFQDDFPLTPAPSFQNFTEVMRQATQEMTAHVLESIERRESLLPRTWQYVVDERTRVQTAVEGIGEVRMLTWTIERTKKSASQ